MEWHLVPAAACALTGAVSGLLVPQLIGRVPEPEPDPNEKPGDFPDKVPYVDLAARPHLALWSAVACAVAGAAIGLVIGWTWGLPWLLFLLPVSVALAVIDFVTWYLPTRIIWPSYLVVAVLVVVAVIALRDLHVLADAGVGFVLVGGYYGLMRLISPRMMAGGDVRLGGLLGLALGPFGLATLLLSVMLAAVSLLVALVPMRLLGRTIEQGTGVVGRFGRQHVPFGPFLLIGALLAVLLGHILAAL
jgi:leader peptidase (prepilin peptidase)/N-methyltransferase